MQLLGGPSLLTSEQNPPQPMLLDIDANHLLVGRADNVEVFDLSSNNSKLLQLTIAGIPSSIPTYTLPADMQLAGQQLAIRNGNTLYVYDLTGTIQHSWPLPSDARLQDGTTTSSPTPPTGSSTSSASATASTKPSRPASLARFIDTGLAYANGPHLKLIPFAQLPGD